MDAHHRGRILELALDAGRRRSRGRHFTARAVAERMARYAVARPGVRVLDPACGAGALLAAAARCGAHDLVGVDVDPEATAATRAALGPSSNVIEGDFLTLDPRELDPPFDAVLANPPYLRQESIAADRKDELRRQLAGELAAPGAGRTDLLGYFLLQLGRYLRPGGRLAFLASGAWLASRYGAAMRIHLARSFRIDRVLESAVEPWFPEARTRPVLLLAERTERPEPAHRVSFVQLRRPIADEGRDPPARMVPQAELASGAPWSEHLRTPSVLGALRERLPAALCSLGELAEARFGIKTGADRFFLFRKGINGDGDPWPGPRERLLPIVVSPMDVDRIRIEPTRLQRTVLVARPEDAADPAVAAFLARGEAAGISRRATCRGRERRDGSSRWFTVGVGDAAPLAWCRTAQYRHLVPANPGRAVINNNLIPLLPRPSVELEPLLAALNSGWTFLERYARGRVSNEGKTRTEVGDVERLRVPDPGRLAGVSLAPLMGRRVGALDDEMGRADRRAFESSVLVGLGIPEREARDWVERLAVAVTELLGRERGWERRYRQRRRRGSDGSDPAGAGAPSGRRGSSTR